MTSSVSSLSYHNLFNIYLFIYLAMLSLHCSAGISLVVTSRGHSSYGAWVSHCCGSWALWHSGFSSCDFWDLEYRLRSCGAQVNCPKACGVFRIRVWIHLSCIDRCILLPLSHQERSPYHNALRFIYVILVVCSFFVEYYSNVQIDHILFTHLSADDHLNFLHFWLLWIKILWKFMYNFLYGHSFFILVG